MGKSSRHKKGMYRRCGQDTALAGRIVASAAGKDGCRSVAAEILVSALVSAVLSKTAIPSFTREPGERRMCLGSTIACFVAGIVFIAGSGYLLLAIWLFFETETPFYVYLPLTACFGMILSIGKAVMLVTAKHRKQ